MKRTILSPFQIEMIRQNNSMSDRKLAEFLNCRPYDIKAFRKKDGIKKYKKMSSELKKFILDNSDKSIKELSEITGISRSNISTFLRSNGIKKYRTRRDKAKKVSHREFMLIKEGLLDYIDSKKYNAKYVKSRRYARWEVYELDQVRELLRIGASINFISYKLDRTISSIRAIIFKMNNNLI